MKLIVGLGNPGSEYAGTRHNLGFEVVDKIVSGKTSSPEVNKKLESIVYKLGDLILIKPQTFMNVSGKAVAATLNFYKTHPENLLVIHDDVDFELGEIKHQFDKSSAGNRGVESIIQSIGSQSFHRLRLGIDHALDVKVDTSAHVLERFSQSEEETADKMIERAAEVALNWVKEN